MAKLGLSLSGGGFRATLFHLGVVKALSMTGLLPEVSRICSVSGGSILAADLVLKWEDYRQPDRFDEAAKAVLKLTRSDLRGKILRRYPLLLVLRALLFLPGLLVRLLPEGPRTACRAWLTRLLDRLTPTGLLKAYCEDLYGKVRLGGLPPVSDRAPELRLLATNLTKASVCSFERTGFRSHPDVPHNVVTGQDTITVAEAVAGSSAFPGLFPPLHLRHDEIRWNEAKDFSNHSQYVSDGGIYDNLAFAGFDELEPQGQFDWILVSDAGSKADWSLSNRMRFVVASVLRTINLIMHLKEEEIRTRLGKLDKIISICLRDPHGEDRDRVNALSLLRTDLDRFTPDEIVALAQHGYRSTVRKLREAGLRAGSLADEPPQNWPLDLLGPFHKRKAADKELKSLRKGSKRNLLALFQWRDPVGLAALVLVALIPWLLLWLYQGAAAYYWVATNSRGFGPVEQVPYDETDRAIGRPGYAQFEIVSDRRIFDLRRWQDVSSRPRKESSVTMRHRVELVPQGSESSVIFRELTSGKDVYLSADGNYGTKRIRGLDSPLGNQSLQVRALMFSLDEPSDLATLGRVTSSLLSLKTMLSPRQHYDISYKATFVNAFQDPEQWWAGAPIDGRTGRASITIFFPPQWKFPSRGKRFRCFSTDSSGYMNEIGCGDGLYYFWSLRALHWEIDDPREGQLYSVSWRKDRIEPTQESIDRAQDLFKRQINKETPTVPSTTPIEEADTLSPQYRGFAVTRDLRIVDLRAWQPKSDSPSRVTMIRRVSVKPKGPENAIILRTRTTGDDIIGVCDVKRREEATLPCCVEREQEPPVEEATQDCSVEREAEPRQNGFRYMNGYFNLHSVGLDEEVTLILRTTFDNAFQTPDQWWAGIFPDGSFEVAELFVISDGQRPLRNLVCGTSRYNASRDGCQSIGELVRDSEDRYAYLKVHRPDPDLQYILGWDWSGLNTEVAEAE